MKNLSRNSFWLTFGVMLFGSVYTRSAHATIGWPLAIVFGICFGLLMVLFFSYRAVPAPFRLVARLANDDTGNSEDDKMFEKLHARFKAKRTNDSIFKFDGFDIGGGYVIFYFRGANGKMVRDAVLSLLTDCTFREGSYFEIEEKDRQPIPAV